jgi:phosphotransferase system HPr-like phosphotransfer protein
MVKRLISMNGITDVTKMVTLAMMCDGDIVISSGRYAVDAKSILGVFSLDLTRGVNIEYPEELVGTEFDEFIKTFETC